MRENTVQTHLFWKYRSASDLLVPGYAPDGWWENDLFRLTNAGYWYEYEFKSSMRDFQADFKKMDNHPRLVGLEEKIATWVRFRKHSILGGTDEGNDLKQREVHPQARQWMEDRFAKNDHPTPKGCGYPHPPGPNRFIFVVPERLEEKAREALPEYAGLMLVRLTDEGTTMERVRSVKEVVKAPQRHRRKVFDPDNLREKLFETFYWRYWRSK